MIKAVLFDLDNTLIDFMTMKKMSCEAALSAMIDAGLEINHTEGMRDLFELYDEHGLEEPQIFQKFIKRKLGKIDYRILANGINAYRRVRWGFLEAYPNTHEVLLELIKKNKKLAIVTDAPRLKAWLRLTSMKLHNFFDVVVTFEDTKTTKPSRLPFEAALNKLNLKAEECLMLGDWPERDIKGAKKLNMKTCFAKYGNRKVKSSGADFEINNIKELLDVVNELE
ncbi:MAG: HAD-IA family hydrolase [Candidatus Woesearchaeota archaeon]|jgi:putative hydrolase of the HAD superfamily|nr:HAD-IA family hydrolase [Candidatus Woesearchaeota archaeon]MDP7457449.1 HAD-IA family hydrolase [Candidatus Woesearchaeota archaeon]